jgi:hypothetical protein
LRTVQAAAVETAPAGAISAADASAIPSCRAALRTAGSRTAVTACFGTCREGFPLGVFSVLARSGSDGP